MSRAYHTEIAPQVMPTGVEKEILITDPEWVWPVLGYVDVEEATGRRDTKTAARAKTQADLNASLQAGIYLLDSHVQGLPEHFVWDVTLKSKKGGTQTLERTIVDHNHTRRFIDATQRAIALSLETGIFHPALPGSWWCSARFCGYHSFCPYAQREGS